MNMRSLRNNKGDIRVLMQGIAIMAVGALMFIILNAMFEGASGSTGFFVLLLVLGLL